MANTGSIDSIFNPRSVAIVGISTNKSGSVAEAILKI